MIQVGGINPVEAVRSTSKVVLGNSGTEFGYYSEYMLRHLQPQLLGYTCRKRRDSINFLALPCNELPF